MMNFKGTDNFMHFFWDRKDQLLNYFKKVDKKIEEIYTQVKPDHIMIISDLGFTDGPSNFFYINTYLESLGLLKRASNTKGRFFNFIYNAGAEVGKRFGFIRNLFPTRVKQRIKKGNMKDKTNWEETKAYANWFAGIFLNPKYYPDEKSKKKGGEEVKKQLLAAKDPKNGKSIFLTAKTKWEHFKGPYFDIMPEVVYTTTKDYTLNINPSRKLIDKLNSPGFVGSHNAAFDGIILLWGEKVKKGVKLEGSLEDIFPTACVLGDQPIPDDVDGWVSKEALIEGSYKEIYKDLPYTENRTHFLSVEEDKSVKEHLKNLGYL